VQCSECGHSVPDGKTKCLYCGAAVEGKEPSSVEPGNPEAGAPDWMVKLRDLSDQDAVLTFGLRKTEKRKPMSKVTLMIIFMSSFVFGGLLVWLLA
jgi:hypothetical protein